MDRILTNPRTLACLLAHLENSLILRFRLISKAVNNQFLDPALWSCLFKSRFPSNCCIPSLPLPIAKEDPSSPLPPLRCLFQHFVYHPWRTIPVNHLTSTLPGCYPIKHIDVVAWDIGGLPFGLRPESCNRSFGENQVIGFGINLAEWGLGGCRDMLKTQMTFELKIPNHSLSHWRSISLHFFDRYGNETRNIIWLSTSNKTYGGFTFRISDFTEIPAYIELVSIEDACGASQNADGDFALRTAEKGMLSEEEKDSIEFIHHHSLGLGSLGVKGGAEESILIPAILRKPAPMIDVNAAAPFRDFFDYKLDYSYGLRNYDKSQFESHELSRLLVKVFDSRKQKLCEASSKHASRKTGKIVSPHHHGRSCLDTILETAAFKMSS